MKAAMIPCVFSLMAESITRYYDRQDIKNFERQCVGVLLSDFSLQELDVVLPPFLHKSLKMPLKTSTVEEPPSPCQTPGGADGTRTRDPRRDRPVF